MLFEIPISKVHVQETLRSNESEMFVRGYFIFGFYLFNALYSDKLNEDGHVFHI